MSALAVRIGPASSLSLSGCLWRSQRLLDLGLQPEPCDVPFHDGIRSNWGRSKVWYIEGFSDGPWADREAVLLMLHQNQFASRLRNLVQAVRCDLKEHVVHVPTGALNAGGRGLRIGRLTGHMGGHEVAGLEVVVFFRCAVFAHDLNPA